MCSKYGQIQISANWCIADGQSKCSRSLRDGVGAGFKFHEFSFSCCQYLYRNWLMKPLSNWFAIVNWAGQGANWLPLCAVEKMSLNLGGINEMPKIYWLYLIRCLWALRMLYYAFMRARQFLISKLFVIWMTFDVFDIFT